LSVEGLDNVLDTSDDAKTYPKGLKSQVCLATVSATAHGVLKLLSRQFYLLYFVRAFRERPTVAPG
jgi:hypothetical protein